MKYTCRLLVLTPFRYSVGDIEEMVFSVTVDIVGVLAVDDENVRGDFRYDPDDAACADIFSNPLDL